jgi:hypothetical protein
MGNFPRVIEITPGGLPIRDTADCQSALRALALSFVSF